MSNFLYGIDGCRTKVTPRQTDPHPETTHRRLPKAVAGVLAKLLKLPFLTYVVSTMLFSVFAFSPFDQPPAD
jgi:hypothetical protein